MFINMALKLRFDNRGVVVTGAGSGLGRAYALEFAKRGAKVVVNDLGVSRTGEGVSGRAADIVVADIKKIGGVAVANYDSVELGDNIIQTAIKNFGRVDIVINNAGILRDVSMLKMTDKDWNLIMKIHLKGSFAVTRAAWKYMKENNYGRIINTSSGSGIYGNFGQANYSAAKLGLHGFTQTIAKEGEKYNIKVNSISPSAASRMTEDLFTPDMLALLVPEKVVPLVVYLAHESNNETGGLFEVAGGYIGRLRWQRTQGSFFAKPFTAEEVQERWGTIKDFTGPNDNPTSMPETLMKVMKLIEQSKPKV